MVPIMIRIYMTDGRHVDVESAYPTRVDALKALRQLLLAEPLQMNPLIEVTDRAGVLQMINTSTVTRIVALV